ncbi:hypothetical protein M2419_002108 [Sphingobacterium sp. BIGb0116]|nr:hypothetical protein [Sphingobacterium sp. BIGb0116]
MATKNENRVVGTKMEKRNKKDPHLLRVFFIVAEPIR